jgi:branched-chain amino acid aminotransferase
VAEERPLDEDEFLGAEAVFLTNSLRGIAPVRAIGARTFAESHPTVIALVAALRRLMGL